MISMTTFFYCQPGISRQTSTSGLNLSRMTSTSGLAFGTARQTSTSGLPVFSRQTSTSGLFDGANMHRNKKPIQNRFVIPKKKPETRNSYAGDDEIMNTKTDDVISDDVIDDATEHMCKNNSSGSEMEEDDAFC